MNWDDLRFVLALSDAGSLARAAKALGVDHTTVGRRIEAAEAALGVSLFTRTTTGYVPTADADRLLAGMKQVEEAVLAVERSAHADRGRLEGTVRVTSPETFGVAYLAPRLAAFGRAHPDLTVELVPGAEVLDLGRRQAELAVRPFRSTHASLVVRKAGEIRYGLFASAAYLEQHPVHDVAALHEHPILGVPEANAIETMWLERLDPRARPSFVSSVSLALLAATRAAAGIAVLPRYLGDAEPTLTRIAVDGEPTEPVWLTVHRDLRDTPRVRALLDFLGDALAKDAAMLMGG
ncbi:MAG: LysR family transcriptional regulator [Myxococcales bacterium]|jgi:DNA-binding transcriptional LysR family regulator|nr:LysR family transcriptional regulator [Myxococcales bacterium]